MTEILAVAKKYEQLEGVVLTGDNEEATPMNEENVVIVLLANHLCRLFRRVITARKNHETSGFDSTCIGEQMEIKSMVHLLGKLIIVSMNLSPKNWIQMANSIFKSTAELFQG